MKDILQAVGAFALLCGWFTWVSLLFCFGLAGESMTFFSNLFWAGIGRWLFKIGVPRDVVTVQFMLSWFSVILFLMLAPLLVLRSLRRKSEEDTCDRTAEPDA